MAKQALKKIDRKEKHCSMKIKESLQQENHSSKETFTVAEKKFQKQIADVPIFDCITCEQTLFRKYVIPIKQEYQQTESRQRKRKKSTEMRMNLDSDICICKNCKKALKNDVKASFTVKKKSGK